MAESPVVNTRGPWFCPYCGVLCHLTACDNCFAPQPFEMSLHNPATSILSFWHGPIGIWGLPRQFALFLLLFNVTSISDELILRAEISRYFHKYATD